jgi:Aerotolerance regulator N-terminal
MIQFAQPIFLWALAGLVIPIAIHLLSRKEGKVVKMGSVRHLRETSTQQFRGIKLNEILLLALRCLLITLFIFLLSGLHWKDENSKRWLVVEKGLERNPIAEKMMDSLKAQGYEMHWLQKDFPLEKVDIEKKRINYWQMVEDLQNQNLEQAVVFSQSRMEDFKGMRIAIASTIRWITLPSEPTEFIAEAIQTPEHILIRRGHSQADVTKFETQQVNTVPDSIELKSQQICNVFIVSDPEFENDSRMLKAALTAISKTLPIKINITESSTEKNLSTSSNWIFWLSNKKAISDTNRLISYQPKSSNDLIERITKNQWAFTKRLTIEIARKENLTLQLASLFVNEKEKWNRISDKDRRVISDSLLFSNKKYESVEAKVSLTSPAINQPLLLLFLLILLAERLIAYKRNQ